MFNSFPEVNILEINSRQYMPVTKLSVNMLCIYWEFALWIIILFTFDDRLCDLVVRVLGYRSGDPGSIPGTTRKKVVGLERGPLGLVSTTEELLDRKVAAPV
jgi:hypothetical protein